MRSVRTTLKLAPKTQDDEYNRRKKALKELHSALHTYKSSMEKVKSHFKDAVESLSKVKAVFEKMTESPETPDNTRDLVLQFGATVDRITGDSLVEYKRAMDSDVIPAVLEMKKLYDDCATVEKERNKVMKAYDVYRNEAAKTEAEYAKKNKDLTVSKTYGTDVVKRNEYQTKFEEADMHFKTAHDCLVSNSARCTNHCMVAFFRCTANFTQSINEEFATLYTTARSVEQEELTQPQ